MHLICVKMFSLMHDIVHLAKRVKKSNWEFKLSKNILNPKFFTTRLGCKYLYQGIEWAVYYSFKYNFKEKSDFCTPNHIPCFSYTSKSVDGTTFVPFTLSALVVVAKGIEKREPCGWPPYFSYCSHILYL